MPDVRTFYRIVLTDPPKERDMMSHHALGLPARSSDPDTLRIMRGLSVFSTLQQARNQAAGRPWQGNAFIAELRMSDATPVTIERTTTSRGHHTLWAEPHDILGLVVRVLPARDEKAGTP